MRVQGQEAFPETKRLHKLTRGDHAGSDTREEAAVALLSASERVRP